MKLSSNAIKDGWLDANFGKHATEKYLINGEAKVSFDIHWEIENTESKYLHLFYIDYDAIEVAAVPMIHWSVANIDLKKYPHGLEENASFLLKDQLIQGINSRARNNINDSKTLEAATSFLGSYPPFGVHHYTLLAWTTKEPLNLKNGFWPNQMLNQLNEKSIYEKAKLIGKYPAARKK